MPSPPAAMGRNPQSATRRWHAKPQRGSTLQERRPGGCPPGSFWVFTPMAMARPSADHAGMNSRDRIDDRASAVLSAARDLQGAAGEPGSREAAATALGHLDEALQALSASWYEVAADAVPASQQRRRPATPDSSSSRAESGLSREAELRLIGALHDVAAGFARAARVCRDARPTVAQLVERGAAHERSAPRLLATRSK